MQKCRKIGCKDLYAENHSIDFGYLCNICTKLLKTEKFKTPKEVEEWLKVKLYSDLTYNNNGTLNISEIFIKED